MYTSKLNFSVNRVAFSDDEIVTNNPTLRAFDWTTSRSGLPVRNVSSSEVVIPAGASIVIGSTEYQSYANQTTTLNISYPIELADIARYRVVSGTMPGLRNYKNLGVTADTKVLVIPITSSVAMLAFQGTPVTVAAASIGDLVYLQPSDDIFTSPFSAQNTLIFPGTTYKIVDISVTNRTITIQHKGNLVSEEVTLGESFADAFRVFSSPYSTSGQGVPDDSYFVFSSENLVLNNKPTTGLESILVTDRDMYFPAPDRSIIPQSGVALGVSGGIRMYKDLMNFVVIDASGPIGLGFNSGTPAFTLTPIDATGATFFAGAISASSILAANQTNVDITVRIQVATL